MSWNRVKKIFKKKHRVKTSDKKDEITAVSILGNTDGKNVKCDVAAKGYEVEDGYTANGRKRLTIRW